MKKLMIVQLGVILAFAASTTAFAAVEDAKSDKSSQEALGGRAKKNEKVEAAQTAVSNSGSGSSKEINRGDEKEIRSSTSGGKSDLERAQASFKNISKMDVGAKYAKDVEAIKNDPSLHTDLDRIDAIAKLLKISREKVLENCENI